MDVTYDFTALRAETAQREKLLVHFDRFRSAFLAQIRHFLAAAKVEAIYEVSDLERGEHEHRYKFRFNGLPYTIIANNTALRIDPQINRLAARIVIYYNTDPDTPLFDVVFQAEDGPRYGFTIERNLTSGWSQMGQFVVKSDGAGAVAAQIIAEQIIATRASWLKDVPVDRLAAGQQGSANPIGFRGTNS